MLHPDYEKRMTTEQLRAFYQELQDDISNLKQASLWTIAARETYSNGQSRKILTTAQYLGVTPSTGILNAVCWLPIVSSLHNLLKLIETTLCVMMRYSGEQIDKNHAVWSILLYIAAVTLYCLIRPLISPLYTLRDAYRLGKKATEDSCLFGIVAMVIGIVAMVICLAYILFAYYLLAKFVLIPLVVVGVAVATVVVACVAIAKTAMIVAAVVLALVKVIQLAYSYHHSKPVQPKIDQLAVVVPQKDSKALQPQKDAPQEKIKESTVTTPAEQVQGVSRAERLQVSRTSAH